MSKIKVMLLDDSAVVRQVLQGVLNSDPAIDVIGAASDPLFAMNHMAAEWPDVLVLDVEMPRMDGISFLKKIMAERPTPVVICSSISQKGSETAMQALAAGAVGVVPKPGIGNRRMALEDAASDLIRAVKAAAHANVRNLKIDSRAPPAAVMPKLSARTRT